jgi:hypothetical protein
MVRGAMSVSLWTDIFPESVRHEASKPAWKIFYKTTDPSHMKSNYLEDAAKKVEYTQNHYYSKTFIISTTRQG